MLVTGLLGVASARERGLLTGRIVGYDPKHDGYLVVTLRHLDANGWWVPPRYAKVELADGTNIRPLRLEPGKYRVGLHVAAHEMRCYEIEILAGGVTRFVEKIGPKVDREVILQLDAADDTTKSIRFNLNRVAWKDGRDIGHGHVSPGERLALTRLAVPRPGAYLLILWDHGLVRPVTITGARKQELRFAVPAHLPHPGELSLEVRLLGPKGRVAPFLVALRRPGERDVWMRYVEAAWKKAEFTGLEAGKYEVLAYGQVFDYTAGFKAQPVVATVELKEEHQVLEIHPLPE